MFLFIKKIIARIQGEEDLLISIKGENLSDIQSYLKNAKGYTIEKKIEIISEVVGQKIRIDILKSILHHDSFNEQLIYEVVFFKSIMIGNIDYLKVILGLGFDPATSDNFAICLACAIGNQDVVKFLLETKMVDEAFDDDEPLIYAVKYNHVSVVQLLLKQAKVDVNARGHEAICIAIDNDNLQMVEVIVAHYRMLHNKWGNNNLLVGHVKKITDKLQCSCVGKLVMPFLAAYYSAEILPIVREKPRLLMMCEKEDKKEILTKYLSFECVAHKLYSEKSIRVAFSHIRALEIQNKVFVTVDGLYNTKLPFDVMLLVGDFLVGPHELEHVTEGLFFSRYEEIVEKNTGNGFKNGEKAPKARAPLNL